MITLNDLSLPTFVYMKPLEMMDSEDIFDLEV